MNLDKLLGAVGACRAGGHAIAAWSVFASETRRASVGTKDRATGDP